MLRKGRHGSEPWPLWTETKGSGDFQQDSFQNVPVHSFQSHLERYWAHGEAAAVTQRLCHFEEKEKKKKKKEARETETLIFTTAHSFKQPICQTRLNITPGTTVFSFLVFDFKWNDSFLIVCHNPKSVVSDFNSNWTHTHTHTQAHAHARTRAHTCSHEQTNAHVHACIQSCSRGGG